MSRAKVDPLPAAAPSLDSIRVAFLAHVLQASRPPEMAALSLVKERVADACRQARAFQHRDLLDYLPRRYVRCARHCRRKMLILSISGYDPQQTLSRVAGGPETAAEILALA